MVLQHLIVLLIALCGLLFFPKYDSICAFMGWSLLLSYTVIARLIVGKMGQALSLLRSMQAIKYARILSFLVWGPPGKFWLDISYMVNFYVREDSKQAEAVYARWQQKKLPKSIADILSSYAMIGLLLSRDWQLVISKYEESMERFERDLRVSKKKDARFPAPIAIPAIRAYCELSCFEKAKKALVIADLPSANYSRDSLETLFLAYFALLGSQEDLEKILAAMKANRSALPEHARLYWQGRCFQATGNYEASILSLAESLRLTPESDSAWRERTVAQMKHSQELLQSRQEPSEPSEQAQQAEADEKPPEPGAARMSENEKERLEAIKEGRLSRQRCIAVSEILASKKPPQAARVLTALISVTFVCCFSPYIFGDKSFLNISIFAFNWGVLDGRLVLAGQWWRLISYQFLHGGLSHLFMNIFALIWFGRYVEGIFGSARFLIIYFGSGIFSGLAQILVDPNGQAVGASGSILGVFGAGFAATLRLKEVLPAQLRRHELSWMIALALTQLLFDQLVNFLFPAQPGREAVRIAAAAHFGGMLSGFLLGWLLPMPKLGTDQSETTKSEPS